MYFADSTPIHARCLFPLKGTIMGNLSRLLPGKYCSMMLGDFGTEVIKVEEPGE
jgi:crotonobetainyl-CoA:carnitine CoA-transferase CaiB-like acyl-CoA transferase